MQSATASDIRQLERAAIDSGIPEYTLMRRAGEYAARIIRHHAGNASRFVILSGGGNNGGDALVAARELAKDHQVVIIAAKAVDLLEGTAAIAAADLPLGLDVYLADGPIDHLLFPGDFIVDGLLGIGFDSKTLRTPVSEIIDSVNRSGLPVASLDLPSGINSDNGHATAGKAVKAAITITFGLPKPGLFCNDGAMNRGILRVVDIGLPELEKAAGNHFQIYTMADASRDLPKPAADIHKYRRGSLLIAAGSRDYPGAAALTARAGLRGGAGMVYLATPAGVMHNRPLPDALIRKSFPVNSDGAFHGSGNDILNRLSPRINALVAGPGWGRDVSPEFLRGVLDFPAPLLLDADALNLLAENPDFLKNTHRTPENTVITPHEGEALRLAAATGTDAALLKHDRMAFAAELAAKLNAVTVLKGAQTITAAPDGLFINSTGTPHLATAGSGDVLSGLIGAYLANGLAPATAARLGVFLHGLAGELGGAGTIADDLPQLAARSAAIAALDPAVF